ncbi:GNAT family N-acetyltransferase [Nocardioides flavescens]|uniref:GNAT family N-acetyltransferase n=1 Tax=Nocardioides flavescens TaxID=2691959 RepID=A0A6L7F0M3_9ACTN|nr:GNAT family N-acetyltransferase [Nocardioides flavescens]MXG90071.1 GNAT family N-acetyltransferase [Nocardioides flavescens]
MRLTALPFAQLDPLAAYGLWKLRQDVFVVEQQCPYPDLDGRDLDPETRHVLLLEDDHETVVGCARVLDELLEEPVWRIGRVCLHPTARGRGLADAVMEAALQICPGRDVVLDAQAPLAEWYAGHGFEVVGEEFLEDGIPHLPMRLVQGRTPQVGRHL